MSDRTKAFLKEVVILFGITYLFFLSMQFMSSGMKTSFKEPLHHFLESHAADFTELVSFVIGIIGTSVVQSSSTVTSMVVNMTADGTVPVLIAIGIVHGANLGTSVTSSLVAFTAETKPFSGNPLRDFRDMLFAERSPGFHRAVSTAVVHGMFNAILVTLIILFLELPFGLIHKGADFLAGTISDWLLGSDAVLEAAKVITPKAYTKPVATFLMGTVGLPGWLLVLLGFILLFVCLKLFSSRMKSFLLADTDPDDVEGLGRKLLGSNPVDTFLRGLGLTILVQSSSATTSMVVPLAGMGFFSVRQIFPFIMGANIGTTVTALLAATSRFGDETFHVAMTIALCHLLLNTVAVIMVAVIPGLYTSVMGCTEFLADVSQKAPIALLGYLAALSIALPAIVYFLPTVPAALVMGTVVMVMLIGPHIRKRRTVRSAPGDALG